MAIPRDEADGLYQGLADGETFSATAFIGHVRILELKRGAQTFRGKINHGTVEETQAVVGDNDFDIILLEHDVIRANIVRQFDRVGPTGAAGFFHAQAQTETTVPVEKTTYPLCCGMGQTNSHGLNIFPLMNN